MNIIPEDECCGPRLSQALFDGYDAMRWECPECGCAWQAEVHRMEAGEAVWRWEVKEQVHVFGGARRSA